MTVDNGEKAKPTDDEKWEAKSLMDKISTVFIAIGCGVPLVLFIFLIIGTLVWTLIGSMF